MNNIAINNTIQTVTASRKTTTKATGSSDFGIALQSAFSYSEARGVNAISSNALEMLDVELEDMYVVSNAHKLQKPLGMWGKISESEYSNSFEEIWQKGIEIKRSNKCIPIALDEGELPEFVKEIQVGLADGKSLRDVLQKRYNDHGEIMGLCHKEVFYIDPDSGSVEFVDTKNRHTFNDKQFCIDKLTSYAIADDIATVLHYTFFKEETDDAIKVQTLISGICERSMKYNTDRFDPQLDTMAHTPEEWAIIDAKYCDEEVTESDDMIDSLLELLDRHFKAEQKREAENDDFGSSSLTVAAMAAKIAVSKTNDTSTLAI